MEPNNHKRRTPRIAWALSAALATTSCVGVPQERAHSRSELPTRLDGGTGQLLSYCGKLRKAGKLVMAAGICERAYRLDPGDPEPLVQLAEILVELGQLEGAEKVYRTAIEIAPDHVEARYMLGKTYIALEKYDFAIIELESALSRKAGDPRIYNALGVANGLIGAHDSAQRVFRAGLQRAPGDASLRNNLGLSLAMSGRYDEGISMLQAIATSQDANQTSHQNLQLALGMARDARAENDLALAAPPEDLMGLSPDDQEAMAPDGLFDPLHPDSQLQVAEYTNLDDQYEEDDADSQSEFEPMVLTEALPPIDLSSQQAAIVVFEDSDPLDLPPELPLLLDTAGLAEDESADSADTSGLAEMMSPSEGSDAALLPSDGTSPGDESFDDPFSSDEDVDLVSVLAYNYPESAPTPGTGDARGYDEYSVQLASYRSEEHAVLGWKLLTDTAPDLFRGISPMLQSADFGPGDGVYHRLRTQVITKHRAQVLCSALKSRGLDCLVVKEPPLTESAKAEVDAAES